MFKVATLDIASSMHYSIPKLVETIPNYEYKSRIESNPNLFRISLKFDIISCNCHSIWRTSI